MKLLYQLFGSLLLSSSFFACKKTPSCEEPLNVNQSSIEVIFKDRATDKYLYAEIAPLYNKDSIKVYDPGGYSLYLISSLAQIPNTPRKYWRINFGNLYDEQTDFYSFDTEVCKSFIVKYTYNESDTITTCFKSIKTVCGSVFETLKVYNKGILLSTVNKKTFAEITLIKN